MSRTVSTSKRARCACGGVEAEAVGAPIACVSCFCDDCQRAASQLVEEGARPVQDPHGGTPLVLYRRDRFHVVRGDAHLRPHKLRADSITSRMVASCCDTPMFLAFERGPHWVSIFRSRLEEPPPVEMRIATKHMPTFEQEDGIPHYPTFPWRLPAKLVASRIAMLFKG